MKIAVMLIIIICITILAAIAFIAIAAIVVAMLHSDRDKESKQSHIHLVKKPCGGTKFCLDLGVFDFHLYDCNDEKALDITTMDYLESK